MSGQTRRQMLACLYNQTTSVSARARNPHARSHSSWLQSGPGRISSAARTCWAYWVLGGEGRKNIAKMVMNVGDRRLIHSITLWLQGPAHWANCWPLHSEEWRNPGTGAVLFVCADSMHLCRHWSGLQSRLRINKYILWELEAGEVKHTKKLT